MKKKSVWLMLLAVLWGVTGCAGQSADADREGAGEASVGEDTGEKALQGVLAPLAEYHELDVSPTEYHNCEILDGGLLFTKMEWLAQENIGYTVVCRKEWTDEGEPRIVEESERGIEMYYLCWTDREGSLLIFGMDRREGGDRFFVKKKDDQGQEVYCCYLETPVADPGLMAYGDTDAEGNSALYNRNGDVYTFDSQGQETGCVKTELTQVEGILDAGEDGLFLYQNQWATGKACLQRIDCKAGTLDPVREISVNGLLEEREGFTVLGGGELGLLLSSVDTLWSYHVETGETDELLKWNDPYVNVDGTNVKRILCEASEDGRGIERAQALLQYWGEDLTEAADIRFVDRSLIPERRTVTLGASLTDAVAGQVRRYNRSGGEYVIDIREYDMEQFMDSLLFGKGDIPDLLDIRWTDQELLAQKGILEDLEPYFASSQVVSREDILENVWNAGCHGGVMTGAVTSFTLETLVTTAENVPTDGWDIEDLLQIQEEYPKSMLLEYHSPDNTLRLVLTTGFGQYIDWENMTCRFDSDSFVKLLDDIRGLTYPEQMEVKHGQVIYEDDMIKAFLDREYLIKRVFISSPRGYQEAVKKHGKEARWVGYPTFDGSCWYLMNGGRELAIYSKSSCKEGAWSFIEYLLSEEEQSWYGRSGQGFPVRKESFEEYLRKPYAADNTVYYPVLPEPSEEDRENIRFMAEHSYLGQTSMSKAYTIVSEEAEAFFAGEKNARETAEVIQNRVQLFLDEQ